MHVDPKSLAAFAPGDSQHYGCPISYSHSKGIQGQTFRPQLKSCGQALYRSGQEGFKKAMKKYTAWLVGQVCKKQNVMHYRRYSEEK